MTQKAGGRLKIVIAGREQANQSPARKLNGK
jgi:hypothetical protein